MAAQFKRIGSGPLPSLADACALVGIDTPQSLGPRRFNRVRALDDHRGQRSGSIREITIYGNKGEIWHGAVCMNWRRGEYTLWLQDWQAGRRLSREEREAVERQVKKARDEEARAMRKLRAEAAKLAGELYAATEDSRFVSDAEQATHPYLAGKGLSFASGFMREIRVSAAQSLILAHPLPGFEPQKLFGGRLLTIPIGRGGDIRTLQFITETSDKILLGGGEARGNYWTHIDRSLRPALIGIAEGAATALSVEGLYGIPCVAAISAGNLLDAARSVILDFPTAQICFFADNDPEKKHAGTMMNRGKTEALRAAVALPTARVCRTSRAPSGVVMPTFSEEEIRIYRETKKSASGNPPTDFNDALFIYQTMRRRLKT